MAVATEKQARERVCWVSMAMPSAPAPRDGSQGPRLCKASKCMAWEWIMEQIKDEDGMPTRGWQQTDKGECGALASAAMVADCRYPE